MDQVSFIEKS